MNFTYQNNWVPLAQLVVILSRRPLVVPPSCAHFALACCHIASPCPLVAPYSCLFLSSRQLVVASPLNAPPSPYLIVSLCRSLVVSSRQLVVVSSLVVISFVACCKSKEEASRARQYRLGRMEGSYILPGTKEKPNSSGRGREELVSSQISPRQFAPKPQKNTPWDLTFSFRSLHDQAKTK